MPAKNKTGKGKGKKKHRGGEPVNKAIATIGSAVSSAGAAVSNKGAKMTRHGEKEHGAPMIAIVILVMIGVGMGMIYEYNLFSMPDDPDADKKKAAEKLRDIYMQRLNSFTLLICALFVWRTFRTYAVGVEKKLLKEHRGWTDDILLGMMGIYIVLVVACNLKNADSTTQYGVVVSFGAIVILVIIIFVYRYKKLNQKAGDGDGGGKDGDSGGGD